MHVRVRVLETWEISLQLTVQAGVSQLLWALTDTYWSKTPQCFLLKQCSVLHIVIFFNYAIIKKNSQAKINALLIFKWFQRSFYMSFSFQSWHVLQNNSHFAQLHSLTLFIKAPQTIHNYFQSEVMNGLRTEKNIFPLFQSKLYVCIETTRIIIYGCRGQKGFKEIGHISQSSTLEWCHVFPEIVKGMTATQFFF